METRIKVMYWLTIIALAALILLQGYWLFNQYNYTLQQYEEELFRKTTEVGEMDKMLRKGLQDITLYTTTRLEIKVSQNNTTPDSGAMRWIVETYTLDKNQIDPKGSFSLEHIDSLYATGRKGVKKYRFDIRVSGSEYAVYDALERFQLNELCPFTTERFDSLLQKQGLNPGSVKTEIADSMTWAPLKISHSSLWKPAMDVIYPFNILQREQVRITYQLGIPLILGKMLTSLIGSVILTLLLIFCLIYQIRTIFKQQRIDELRKDFIKTMIHELKRPVATLKLCISFIKNDKMMQDQAMKEEILRSSQNELDNLSSYFSRLRDLTYGDAEEIPLNISTFPVKEMVDECIDKQHLPTDRKINFTTRFDNEQAEITADRMHLSNILCNLLENAVKYSEGETAIHIDCRFVGDKYRIEVADNGFGILPSERAYVFDKFFRGSHVTGKNIPGIGLGLCYVKLLVTAHKGNVSLESRPGEGSRFTIEIPVKQ